MTHPHYPHLIGWIIFSTIAFLLMIAATIDYLIRYEDEHWLPCSLCAGKGQSEDGIKCVFCGGSDR